MKNYIAEAKKLEPWYHAIRFSPEYVTPSFMQIEHQWANNRKVREAIDYKGKSVLDLGTMDGLWAFEAEALGARLVVAADIWQGTSHGFNRFMLAREALNSRVWPVTNGDVHCLYERLAGVMRHGHAAEGFDIVQCLGLLYHVQNPMLALHQVRRCTRLGGVMLLETAYWTEGGDKPMARFNSDLGVYNDRTTYWAMNKRCLFDMLAMCGFQARAETAVTTEPGAIGRLVVICDAMPRSVTTDSFGTE